LYCSCSERVARAIVRDLFRLARLELADLQESMLPQLVEVTWQGDVVDVASPNGIQSAGFSPDYPIGVNKEKTRVAARRWHNDGAGGVSARSASMMRLGFRLWDGFHSSWSETAIFVNNAPAKPVLLRRRPDMDWLALPPETEI